MMNSHRKLAQLLTPSLRREFYAIMALLTVSAVLDIAGVVLIIPFLAVIAEPGIIETNAWLRWAYDLIGAQSAFGFLQILGIATFLFVLLGISLRSGSFYLANVYARRVNLYFGVSRFRGHLARDYEWFLTRHPAEISKSVLQEINEVVSGTVVTSLRIVPTIVQLSVMAGFLLMVEPVATLVIAVVFGGCFLLVDSAVRQRLTAMGTDRMQANRERHQVVGEAVRGIRETKMMSLEDGYIRRFTDPSRRLARHQANVLLIGELPRYALELITFGGMLGLTVYLLWARQGQLVEIVPLLGAFAFAALKLMPALQILFRDIAALRFSRTSLEALEHDLTTAPDWPRPSADVAMSAPLRGDISLSRVGYCYPGTDRGAAISGVTLEIPEGAAVGIAGPTGSGKSTLIDLLLGLIAPTEGSLRVGEKVLDRDTRRHWRRMVGFVPQTIHLVDDTIAANIARGAASGAINMERVRRAALQARLADFVETLPDGYDTCIGDAGIKLSGGQRQRIGIARALYDDHPVLVLDEATSALDADTEADVVAAIGDLVGKRTVIMVSHRISTLAICDTVHEVRAGKLVASGPPPARGSNSLRRASLAQAAS